MAKSGWPVLGQRQVNSGICMWIWKSRFGCGLGKVSSSFVGAAVGAEPKAVKCAAISGFVFVFNGLAATFGAAGTFGLMTMLICVRDKKIIEKLLLKLRQKVTL